MERISLWTEYADANIFLQWLVQNQNEREKYNRSIASRTPPSYCDIQLAYFCQYFGVSINCVDNYVNFLYSQTLTNGGTLTPICFLFIP